MPPSPSLTPISRVFLSATAQDCKVFREALRDAVQVAVPDGHIDLQENWAQGAQFVVDACQQRVQDAHAYLGLFGHRYGWTPPLHDVSITELEFRWAVNHWTVPTPPIFILLPVTGSEADKLLKKAALPFLKAEFPEPKARAAAVKRQQGFIAQALQWAGQDGRLVVYYNTQRELELKGGFSLQNWNLSLLQQALAGRRRASGEIPPQELGHIGRQAQLDALALALDHLAQQPQPRAMALLVHGQPDHGHKEFSHCLLHLDDWPGSAGNPPLMGLPAEPGDTASLVRWACHQLQQPVLGEPTVDALAAVLAARLARRSVVFIVRSLGQQPGRLAHWLQGFWQPLLAALASRAKPAGPHSQLVMLLVDPEAADTTDTTLFWPGALDAPTIDYRRLLALPALGPISAGQVRAWLKDLVKSGEITLDEDRRARIASFATQAGEVPSQVYRQLDLEGFWSANA